MYSMDQSYIGRWIVRLDGYHMIIEHRMRDKHQNAYSLSKKTEFYKRLEQKQTNQAEINKRFSFLSKETYELLPLTSWLDKSGHPISEYPELPKEKATGKNLIKEGTGEILSKRLDQHIIQTERTGERDTKKTVTFVNQDQWGEEVKQNLGQESLSAEKVVDEDRRKYQ